MSTHTPPNGHLGPGRTVGRLHALVADADAAVVAVAGGADTLQYREKRALSTRALIAGARAVLGAIAGRAPLLIDDRVDVAAECGASGVHLGRDDLGPDVARRLLGPGAVIGATANSLAEAVEVHRRFGAFIDYLGVGPVFGTRSKANPAPELGLAQLARIVEAVPLPVIAIGSITAERVAAVLGTGAHGVAILSAVPETAAVRRELDRVLRP